MTSWPAEQGEPPPRKCGADESQHTIALVLGRQKRKTPSEYRPVASSSSRRCRCGRISRHALHAQLPDISDDPASTKPPKPPTSSRLRRGGEPRTRSSQHGQNQQRQRKERAQQHLEDFEPLPVPRARRSPRMRIARPRTMIQSHSGTGRRSCARRRAPRHSFSTALGAVSVLAPAFAAGAAPVAGGDSWLSPSSSGSSTHRPARALFALLSGAAIRPPAWMSPAVLAPTPVPSPRDRLFPATQR